MSALLVFEERYIPRMWGGQRLRDVYGKPTRADQNIGEAWLIADHAQHVSVVAEGPLAGRTLHELVEATPERILGTRPELTVHSRFPLLFKLLDARDKLSIQVHPDDADAARFDEPDVGKAEMWYVLDADEDSAVYCGLPPEVDAETFDASRNSGRLEELLIRIPAAPGTAVYVPAGTVHAIGGGCLLAEIQQNSDLTYRIDDWGRVQADGTPRQLHVEKARDCTRFGSGHLGPATPLEYESGGGRVAVIAACRHFAGERIDLEEAYICDTRGDSFQILLGIHGALTVSADSVQHALDPGRAVMIAGEARRFEIGGAGAFLRYYVPDLKRDIVAPLEAAGYAAEEIVALGGEASISELAEFAGGNPASS